VRYGDEDDIEEKRPGRRKPSTKPQEPGVKLSAMDELKMQGLLEVNALTFIRGRSIPKQFMLIDESQNISAHEAKTIVTRAGEGTKIVFTGDPDQLDNPYLDSCNNGLVYLVNKMKGQGLYGHITLTKGERSELAELAANIL
jgi:PhoH-like ATPase